MRWAAAIAVVVLVAACGGDADNELSEVAARDLQDRVEAIEAAAAAGDPDAARAELDALRLTVVALVEQDEIGEDRAAAISAAADDVEAELGTLPTTTTTTTTTSTTTVPPVEGAKPGKDREDEGDDGPGHGRGPPGREEDED